MSATPRPLPEDASPHQVRLRATHWLLFFSTLEAEILKDVSFYKRADHNELKEEIGLKLGQLAADVAEALVDAASDLQEFTNQTGV